MFVYAFTCAQAQSCPFVRASAWQTERDNLGAKKKTPESGGSLFSRVSRAPGAALFIKTANHRWICLCTPEYVFMCCL